MIQHLTDKIQELEHKLNCLTHNSECHVRNENIAFVHSVVHKYNREHNQPTLSEFEINDLIKMHIKNVSNSLYTSNGQTIFTSVTDYFSNGIQGILNSIIMIVFFIILLIVSLRLFWYCLQKIKLRQSNHYMNIGGPQQIELSNLRQ